MAIDSTNDMPKADRKFLVDKVAGNSAGWNLVLKFLSEKKEEIKLL
jgi:hypothetical protein